MQKYTIKALELKKCKAKRCKPKIPIEFFSLRERLRLCDVHEWEILQIPCDRCDEFKVNDGAVKRLYYQGCALLHR